ncbi:MAG: TIGR03915 family putative DNA repair protein [Bacteroidota bacterium]
MLYYIYDGTFDGFLSAVCEAIERDEVPEQIVTMAKFELNLFVETREIETDFEKAKEFLGKILKKLSREGLKNVLYCYLSEEPGSEVTLCEYLHKVIAGEKIETKLTDPVVLKIKKTGEKVAKEVCRFKGIIRFREIQPGFFYAPIEPDHQISPLLAEHFRKRFADQRWFIHDRRRNCGVLYDGYEIRFLKEVKLKPELEKARLDSDCFSDEELEWQKLWNVYFQNIEIRERSNPKLQKQHLPARYWKYLVEEIGRDNTECYRELV